MPYRVTRNGLDGMPGLEGAVCRARDPLEASMAIKRTGFALCILCLVFCVTMIVAADDAAAQGIIDEEKADKKDPDGPTKFQMIIGIGSVFVMIAVVKFL